MTEPLVYSPVLCRHCLSGECTGDEVPDPKCPDLFRIEIQGIMTLVACDHDHTDPERAHDQ